MKTKSTLFCLLFAVCTNIDITAKAQAVNGQDSLALVDLYNSTDGANWNDHTNWLTGPVKTWYGITVTGTRVTESYLYNNNLSGSIPSSLGNLVNLTYLHLSGNKLSGSIPSTLGNLVNLSGLGLSDNQLSGSIPSSIGNLVNLTELNLSNNQLSGSIPSSLGNLVNLTHLDLFYNQLSDGIPSSLGNLVNLSYLGLSDNQLSGSIPSSIGNLVNLTGLELSHNQLTGSIPSSLGNLVNLLYLLLDNNQLTGSIPSSIGNLVKLTWLILYHNQLSGGIPSSLGNLVKLNLLWLYSNQLSGSIPSSLGNLANLEYMFLNNNQLSGSIPSSLGNLVRLIVLRLSNNQLSGSIPSSLGNLVYVNLSYNKLSGKIPLVLANLRLNLSYNLFTFEGMESVAQKFPHAIYSPQANIPVHQNGNTLSVSAGGTLSINTYKWFRVGQTDSTTIVGDSVFHPSQSGKYFAAVTNSICTQLTLNTDTIDYEVALPVNIINLKAQQQASIIKVEWTSLTEINVAKYEIQRSANASNFTTVGALPATSHGTQDKDYNFNDIQPLQGNNFYRIKAFDKDGKITNSNIVLVNISNDKTITIVVYPIPAKDILHVQTNGNASFSLLDQSGKILLTTNINVNGSIDVSDFAAGLYYLKNNSTGTEQKVIIAR